MEGGGEKAKNEAHIQNTRHHAVHYSKHPRGMLQHYIIMKIETYLAQGMGQMKAEHGR